ncbi:thrombomodulin-like [Anarrhichthys ocellatus]|uniref:thrombomodulin-like n=1 Tax=Anarrhichthys ocellatus TaxID=433405 RepID=UPI0012ECE46A|nr:thrombomodulin-like [Anarrhichthys ocellatus]
MIHSTNALLICVVVLCALEETVLSQRGYCAANQCFAFFLEPKDFTGARKSCSDSGGQLYALGLEHVEEILTVSGSYWVELPSTDTAAEEAAAGLQSCPFISVTTGRKNELQREPCRGTRNGFLCQYKFQEPCSVLQTDGDTQVKYTTPMHFRADESETFPPGTTAVTVKVGGNYPESKHLCFSKGWMQAPWRCEVLWGGCEHNCGATTHTCICPAGKVLHHNNISCTKGPCENNPCTGEGEECENTREGFKCTCSDGFIEEDGGCVNVTICERCEHMCDKFDGVYQCMCKKGFRVAAHDPTKCDMICNEKDCPARCDRNDQDSCYCPDGYIRDFQDGKSSAPFCTDINECEMGHCDHKCENLFGGYQCLCNEGFRLHQDRNTCVPIEEDDDGSGSTPPYPTPAGTHPVAVPSYIKTGSVLGISMFMVLCAGLLYFLIRNAVKRCGRFELSSIKRPDIDIFYLQQVTSEAYKRLSMDKHFKSDS